MEPTYGKIASAKIHRKPNLGKIGKKALIVLGLAILCFIFLFPIVWMVDNSFKDGDTISAQLGSIMTFLPPSFDISSWFVSYEKLFNSFDGFGRSILNSINYCGVTILGVLLINSFAGYALARFKFPGNKLIRNLFTIATLIPGIASQVTVYQIMTALHLVNSLPGYIILMMGTDVITIYIFLQFFENLSSTLDESAILDGCTYFGVFFKILLPLLKPAIVTSAILKGVSTYNEYYMANLYLQDKTKYQVVATSLYVFSGPMGNQYNYICAGVIITIIPALIVFLLCQDQIYSGMAAGAVKG